MEKWIKSINGKIPYTNKLVNIELDGKNLIVTGANGSGKTSLLKAVYENINLLIAHKRCVQLSQLKNDLKSWQENLNKSQKETLTYYNAMNKVHYYETQINTIEKGLQIDIPDSADFSSLYNDKKAVIHFFEEKRLSEIVQPTAAKAITVEEQNAQQNFTHKFANKLEQHLVNLKSRQSLAITADNNQALADDIEKWFIDFKKNLQILFEDPNIELKFDTDKFRFSICQEDKPPYTFQTLSAGYRAIFDIYAELIMRTEYFKMTPNDLTGVVFIDEIDSHLHVSLQRLILPFFAESFPKIQFIVTTHSPFVLMSTPDTVVFDLAKNEPITEDLSYYTYSAVMKGLWNVKPISRNLENIIKEIAQIVISKSKDLQRLRELTDKIKGREDALDSESKAFYLLGLDTLEEKGGDHV